MPKMNLVTGDVVIPKRHKERLYDLHGLTNEEICQIASFVASLRNAEDTSHRKRFAQKILEQTGMYVSTDAEMEAMLTGSGNHGQFGPKG